MVSRRRRPRGAAVFIVVLVVTLLTAIGIFAARAASLVDVAAGHNRQAMQTLYLADYGTRMSLAMMSGPAGSLYREKVKTSTDQCEVNRYAALTSEEVAAGETRINCYKIFSAEASERAGVQLLEQQLATQSGSLGPATHGLTPGMDWTLNGLWVTELVEAVDEGSSEGTDENNPNIGPTRFTVTTYAQIRTGGTDWCGDGNSASAASLHATRAHIVLPAVAR